MPFLTKKSPRSTPITALNKDTLPGWLKKQPKPLQSWIAKTGFTAAPGALLILPTPKGDIDRILFGTKPLPGLYGFAELPGRLPKNEAGYYIETPLSREAATQAAIGWALGSYSFDRYRKGKKSFAKLVWPANADKKTVEATAGATFLVRDLVNTPPNDMGPAELAAAAKKVAGKARFSVVIGNSLKKNYPAVYEVGKGSPRAPRFVEMRWGNAKNPRVTLVGKGVCFDTGGLDIKPASAMALMKKDMGGAAHALGLAQMIMAHNLPVSLRVLLPIVENTTDGSAFRPSDIINTRKGLTVEVGDTDAEGRLILADGLFEACRDKPALVIDFATLTGAARVALGPDLPAMFCNNDKVAIELMQSAAATEDPMWRLPLWQPYKDNLNSKIADTNNIGGSFAGCIIAALFLEKFVEGNVPWVHLDTYAWNNGNRPGRPEGGEALGMRACFDYINKRFGKKKA